MVHSMICIIILFYDPKIPEKKKKNYAVSDALKVPPTCSFLVFINIYTLWLFNIAMENHHVQ